MAKTPAVSKKKHHHLLLLQNILHEKLNVAQALSHNVLAMRSAGLNSTLLSAYRYVC
jgi:hypothetical protein